jgi:hypothetical protein
MNLPGGFAWYVYVAAIALPLSVGYCMGHSGSSVDTKQWESRIERYQQDSAKYVENDKADQTRIKRLDSLAQDAITQRVRAEARAEVEHQQGLVLKTRADAVIAELDSVATTVDSIRLLQEAYTDRTEEAGSLRRENVNLRQAMQAQIEVSAKLQAMVEEEQSSHAATRKRLAIADDLLRDRPKAQTCKIGFVRCPSRTASFIGGVALGVVGVVLVGR